MEYELMGKVLLIGIAVAFVVMTAFENNRSLGVIITFALIVVGGYRAKRSLALIWKHPRGQARNPDPVTIERGEHNGGT